MTASPKTPGAPPPSVSLRLFEPDTFTADPVNLTLREFFETKLLPQLIAERKKPGTIAAYRWALKHWETRTPNPPLSKIDLDLPKTFLLGFAPPEFELATAAKLWRQLKAIFRRAAPESDRNPDGLGLIERIPRVKLKRPPRRSNRLIALEEFDALYDACRVAKWPRIPGVRAPLLWQTSLVCFSNLGPRAWDFFCDRPHANPLPQHCWRWDWINWRTNTLQFVPDKTGDELRLPLHPIVVAHLQAIRTDRTFIFPATRNRHYVYDQWTAIKIAAGFDVEGPEDLDFQEIRANCQTEWDTLHFGLGDYILGHAPEGVGATWYRNFAKLAAEACQRFPQPPSFSRIFTASGPRQLSLFGI